MIWLFLSISVCALAFIYWTHRETEARMVESRAKEAVAKACGPDPRVISMMQRTQDTLDDAARMHARTVAVLERMAGPQKRTGAEILSFSHRTPDDKPPQGAA